MTKKKIEFIRTDTEVPNHVPEAVYKLFYDKFPGALENVQRQSIETIDRITKSVAIPGKVKIELIGALNAFYMSGYWHSVQSEMEAAGIAVPKDLT